MRRGVVALLLVMALGGIADGEPSDIAKVGSGMAKGDFASVSTSSDANAPNEIELTVLADPDQKVDVSWYISCHTEDYSDSGSKSKDFTATTPIQKSIPIPISQPDKCSVHASAFLNDSGRVRLVVTKD